MTKLKKTLTDINFALVQKKIKLCHIKYNYNIFNNFAEKYYYEDSLVSVGDFTDCNQAVTTKIIEMHKVIRKICNLMHSIRVDICNQVNVLEKEILKLQSYNNYQSGIEKMYKKNIKTLKKLEENL